MTTSGEIFCPCAVVPVYDHAGAIGAVVAGLVACRLPCILVDDGSGPLCAATLDRLAASVPAVTLVRRPSNGGKGAAVRDGLRVAAAAGYSHALQIDADGQHAIADVPSFLAAARAKPHAIVCGRPTFDASMPRVRYYGRYLTHAFVWFNTLSFDIPDAMCGFRVYPLGATVSMLDGGRIGLRMDFDIEVLVRLHWRGVPMVWLPTRVTYPTDGISHFRLLLDNALISRVHLFLFLGMVRRIPQILGRRWRARRLVSHA